MKFIPVTSFDKLNAGMAAIEARGCFVTTKLEAFSCRNTKMEKRIHNGIVTNRIQREQERNDHIKTQQQIVLAMTPPMQPQMDPRGSGAGGSSGGGSQDYVNGGGGSSGGGGAFSRPNNNNNSGDRFSLDGGANNNNSGSFAGMYNPSAVKNLDYDDEFRLDGDGDFGDDSSIPQQQQQQPDSRSSWRDECPLPFCGPMTGAHHVTPVLGFQKQQQQQRQNSGSGAFPSVLPSSNMGSRVQSHTLQGETPYTSPQTYQSNATNESSLEDVDNRLVHLVGALNAIHGAVDFDFTCLETSDFNILSPIAFFNEINEFLQSLPQDVLSSTVGPINGEVFWGSIASLVGGDSMLIDLNSGASDCEFFQFVCPSCDPVAQTKIWSNHYFVYNRRNHVIISLLVYGEGNMYRGDATVNSSGRQSPAGDYAIDEGLYGGGGGAAKNASFFGFHGGMDDGSA